MTDSLPSKISIKGDLARGLSILIACYNASDLIAQTLTRLLEMEKVPDLPWEVLIVDNNSTDNTLEIVRSFASKFPQLKIENEPRQGVAFAVLRGIKAASYEYIGIVDQDNWVHKDWMTKAVNYLDQAPRAGIICGRGNAIFESDRPNWFARFQQNFAVGSQSEENGPAKNVNSYYYNAACIMRKAPIDHLIAQGFQPLLTSRAKNKLLAGDDTELQALYKLTGWEVHYQDDLTFDHYMPTHRLSFDYFRDLRKGLGASAVYLNLYRYYLAAVRKNEEPERLNWFKPLLRSFLAVLSDPLAILASPMPKFASNYRVAKYWSKLGEFRERLGLRAELNSIQTDLYDWLDAVMSEMQKDS
jgi:glycosyltransferase involved in cell wall biosynthesis